ncbi:MAG: VWA domain-containing protein [Bryobacteraceae bacterium]
MKPAQPNTRNRGYILLFFVLATIVLFPITGLAVDVVLLYFVKARLVSAVDAGALAGARSLSRGGNFDLQKQNAIDTSKKFFAANFPKGYLLTDRNGPTMTVDVVQTEERTRTVTINANVGAPLYFLRLLSSYNVPVAAMGQTSRRDVNIMMAVDRTGSLENVGACDDVIAASIGFSEKFSEGNDFLGLATFAVSSRADVPLTNGNFKTQVRNVLTGMACQNYTGGSQGLSKAFDELKAKNDPGVLNVILFFTDGIPNSIVATWPTRRAPYYTTAPGTGGSAISPCTDQSDKVGGMRSEASPAYGLYNKDATGSPNPVDPGVLTTATTNNCSFRGNQTSVATDFSYIPSFDFYGNDLRTGFGGTLSLNATTHRSYNYPPVGRKITLNGNNVELAARNALENAAIRIRSDATLNTQIYAVGFGPNVNDDLLRRVANDPTSATYNPAHQTGMYIFAPTAGAISDAFSRIAAEILRISL